MIKPLTSVRLTIAIGIILGSTHAHAQVAGLKPVAQSVQAAKDAGAVFEKQNMQPYEHELFLQHAKEFVSEPVFAKLSGTDISKIFSSRTSALELSIPYKNNSVLTLELVRVELFSDGFMVETSEGAGPYGYSPGVYYQGTIKDDPSSLAAISIFENEMMGIISSNSEGNINIGQYKAGEVDDYLVYSDRDLLVESPSTDCATPEDERFSDAYMTDRIEQGGSRTAHVVDIYLEADYQLYQNKGSVTNTVNYLTGIFNNSQIIFSNDGITVALSEIFVWTSADGYSAASSYDALDDFMNFRTTFNGDVAQLCALDPGGLGGVAATINGLCNPYKYCYSDIDATYSDFPTYSWTVMVFTHELGHVLGSYHTHWCGWPGGAIDNCAPMAGYGTEGGCAWGPAPVDGGTIMSYCHLVGYGINFNNGFGPYPSDAIIDAVEAAGCLGGGGGGSYCTSSGDISNEEWIDKVKVGTIDRVSGDDGGYFNATAWSTNFKQGTSKTIKLSAGMSGGPYTEYWKVWVDWNRDFDFTDTGEEEYSFSSSSTGLLSGTISAPLTASPGMTRMRVSMKYGSAPSSCEAFGYGEVEDYSIQIKSALPGELPDAGDAELVIYPNPVEEEFTLLWLNMPDGEMMVTVFDMAGRMMQKNNYAVADGQTTINISGFNSGIYFIKIVSPDGIIRTERIVKS